MSTKYRIFLFEHSESSSILAPELNLENPPRNIQVLFQNQHAGESSSYEAETSLTVRWETQWHEPPIGRLDESGA
jgi:hypothetical protein